MASSSSSSSSDNEELSIREAKLLEFQEICGLEDENLARSFLERFDWDLQRSVQEYLNEKDGPPPRDYAAERRENEENRNQERRTSDVNASPPVLRRTRFVQQQQLSWREWSWGLITLPFRFVYATVFDILRLVYRLLFGIHRGGGPIARDPVADVEEYIKDYEEKYGSQHPTFYRGSYSNALNDAKKELRFLIVYLHCETHRDTEKFCRTTLANQQVIDFINTNALFWSCSVRKAEGFRVSQAMHETTYPFVSLVAMRENRMMIVLRQEGFCDSRVLLDILSTAVADNEIYVNLARQERQQQQLTNTLRQQQQQAFEESLRRDQEKDRRRAEEENAKRMLEEESRRKEEDAKKKRENFERRKEEIRRTLPPEPDADDPNCVRVKLTFPSGAKLERRFRHDDSLNLLHSVTLCHAECPQNFSIVNVFPRRTLTCETSESDDFAWKTFADEGLLKSITLIVQNNEA